jgi:hypothetical protein
MLNIVSETKHGGRFRATLEDSTPLVKSSRTPLLDSARILLRQGIDPHTPLTMRHARATHDALTSTVGAAAKLTVLVSSVGRPIFGRFQEGEEMIAAAPYKPRNPAGVPRQPPAPISAMLEGDPHQPIFEFRIAASITQCSTPRGRWRG